MVSPCSTRPRTSSRAVTGLRVIMGATGERRTYRELEDASNRVAQLLRARGLRAGDHIAVLLVNRPEWFEVTWGALRAGLYVTPVNFHLTAAEAGYIVADCGAQALVADAELAGTVATMSDDLSAVVTRVAVGGDIPGFEPYADLVSSHPAKPIADEFEGTWMLYSSGTTGRPKGVKPPLRGDRLGAPTPFASLLVGLYGFTESTVYLSPAPLYHAAPAGWTTMTQRLGGTAVVMERFDAEQWLALVERYRVTHSQVVPTHLVRLLKLPEQTAPPLRRVEPASSSCTPPPRVPRR